MSEEKQLEVGTPESLKADKEPDTFFVPAKEAVKIAYTAFRAEIRKILDDSIKRGVNEIELPVTPVDKAALETLKEELSSLGYTVTISSKYSNKQKNELYQGKSGSETILTIRY